MKTLVRRATLMALRNSQCTSFSLQHSIVSGISVSQPRFLSNKSGDDSHSDFKPQYHAAKSSETDEILKMIDDHVKTYPIMLYMKGTPSAPQCGFSMQVVRALHAQGVSFDSVNVLDHPEIREGVKKYSQWPTIPQLYVNGEFVGGCDIIMDMSKSGELSELLANFKKKEA
ncbi:grx4 family monothiol glutaredoxin [Plasmopara halstedii]|uniref:Grx4 family monothiol glutaredoxin n=1 Tax=Plasmopara halstedii TaxID=4781 RepID=A0A0N7L4Q9_PLAHL|nr:grx4 family monothiol glutaredoxin [Plasmopara halstedii]CEG39363.1 grx4 family monothiol glutaredoxin [Plasmopara halstedii]|eukprot:XP_024575732.1 grx4 family monothiol glutaredoxin [Plasmopara halstedii]